MCMSYLKTMWRLEMRLFCDVSIYASFFMRIIILFNLFSKKFIRETKISPGFPSAQSTSSQNNQVFYYAKFGLASISFLSLNWLYWNWKKFWLSYDKSTSPTYCVCSNISNNTLACEKSVSNAWKNMFDALHKSCVEWMYKEW